MKTLRLSLLATLSAACLATPLNASTMVLGGYPNELQLVDESTGTVVQKIKLDTGLPTSLRMSNDRSRIYVTTNTTSGIEVLDTASRTIVNRFSLNTPRTRYRFEGGVPDPTGRYFYTVGKRMDKEIDRWRVSKPQYMTIDLQQKKVVRAVDVAPEDELGSPYAKLVLSDDGKTLYVFRDEVVAVDTTDFKVVERYDLAKPDFPGMLDVSFGGALDTLRTPGQFVSLFNSEDPLVHNKVFGIARFDLASRDFTFAPIGPAPEKMAGLHVTPDGKSGYTVAVNGDLGNQRCEFWHFDLTTNRAVNNREFPCRRRFYFGMSDNGEKLYIYGAGFDVAVYDAQTLEQEQDWELTNDITMAGMLFIR